MNKEHPSTHYLLFFIRSDENCFAASRQRIFPFSFVKKLPHQRNSDETLATKNRFAETINNGLHTIRVLPTFIISLVFRRYSRIMYSGLKTIFYDRLC